MFAKYQLRALSDNTEPAGREEGDSETSDNMRRNSDRDIRRRISPI